MFSAVFGHRPFKPPEKHSQLLKNWKLLIGALCNFKKPGFAFRLILIEAQLLSQNLLFVVGKAGQREDSCPPTSSGSGRSASQSGSGSQPAPNPGYTNPKRQQPPAAASLGPGRGQLPSRNIPPDRPGPEGGANRSLNPQKRPAPSGTASFPVPAPKRPQPVLGGVRPPIAGANRPTGASGRPPSASAPGLGKPPKPPAGGSGLTSNAARNWVATHGSGRPGSAPAGGAAGRGQGSGPRPAGGRPAQGSVGGASAENVPPRGPGSGVGSGPKCFGCGSQRMDAPHEGPCGHMACYSCWIKAIVQQFKCPVCQKPCHRRNLQKAYFA